MTTSRRSNGQGTAPLFSPQECPASLPVVPGSNEARMMTAGSGRKLSEFCANQGPLGQFSRILLESKTFTSTEYLLTWTLRETPSERWERWSIEWDEAFSVKRWKRLKMKDTPSRFLKFQLAPSMPRTSAIDCGLWGTPRKTRGGYCTNIDDPENPILTLEGQAAAAWPSPVASKAGKTSRSGDRKEEMMIGGLVWGTWPTPDKSMDSGGRQSKTPGQFYRENGTKREVTLNELASWPTPRSADGDKGVRTPRGHAKERARRGNGCDLPTELACGTATNGSPAPTVSFAVRLMTLSAWLMGYPVKHFQGLEIPLCRKSRTKSSKP